jgi:hypothetical protein
MNRFVKIIKEKDLMPSTIKCIKAQNIKKGRVQFKYLPKPFNQNQYFGSFTFSEKGEVILTIYEIDAEAQKLDNYFGAKK